MSEFTYHECLETSPEYDALQGLLFMNDVTASQLVPTQDWTSINNIKHFHDIPNPNEYIQEGSVHMIKTERSNQLWYSRFCEFLRIEREE